PTISPLSLHDALPICRSALRAELALIVVVVVTLVEEECLGLGVETVAKPQHDMVVDPPVDVCLDDVGVNVPAVRRKAVARLEGHPSLANVPSWADPQGEAMAAERM